MRMLARALRIPAALLAWGCLFDSPKVAGGGSSETTNGVVAGLIHKSDGTPAINARILLRTRSYLKDTSLAMAKYLPLAADTVTDASGHFYIDSVDPGDYFIEAADGARNGLLFEFSSGDRDTLALAPRILQPAGTVQGIITSGYPGTGNIFVQIYGLDRVVRADSATGTFAFSDLPAGVYTLRAFTPSQQVDPQAIPGISVLSGDTTDIGNLVLSSFENEDYATWPFSTRITLNTTTSGADVPSTVVNFPLLVRLHGGNFDFTASQGGDLRFSARDGSHLRYEIERWDSAASEAEIWVKVDTILGNSNRSFINLHWGKANVPDWSNGRKVFDTTDGFGGVWHLAEESPDTLTTGLYRDATASAGHGDDRITSTDTNGVIGRGHRFNRGDYIQVRPRATLRPPRVMISAWFKGTTTGGSLGSEIASLGDSYGLRVEPNGNVRMFVYSGSNSWPMVITNGVQVLDSSWHLLSGVYTGSTIQVYVDGEIKGSAYASPVIPYNLGPDFRIGRHGTGKREYDFTGSLDEVAVHTRPRSAAWIRLCFESQRKNSTLLEFP